MAMNQRLLSSSLRIESSEEEEEIVEEAKTYLVDPTLEQQIMSSLKKILQPWVGKPFNEYRMYDPKVAIEHYLEKFVEERKIYEFRVEVRPDRSIGISYRKDRSMTVQIIDVQMI